VCLRTGMRHEILNVPILQPPQKTVVRWVQFFEGAAYSQAVILTKVGGG
jgi:hypothetical protein